MLLERWTESRCSADKEEQAARWALAELFGEGGGAVGWAGFAKGNEAIAPPPHGEDLFGFFGWIRIFDFDDFDFGKTLEIDHYPLANPVFFDLAYGDQLQFWQARHWANPGREMTSPVLPYSCPEGDRCCLWGAGAGGAGQEIGLVAQLPMASTPSIFDDCLSSV